MDGRGPLLLRLLRLGLPIAIGRSGVVGMGVVDMIVVGQLRPGELAHQALGWSLNGPALLGGIGLLLGVQVLAARAVGAGQVDAAGPIWRRGLVIALVAGAVVCAVVWLAAGPMLQALGVEPVLARRGAAVAAVLTLAVPAHLAFMASAKLMEALERPVPGAVVMWVANAVNLALNLAFVPQHGAVGSAWATVLSRLFLSLALPAVMLADPAVRRWGLARTAHSGFGYGPLLAIGAAAAASAVVEAAAFAAIGVIAARAGGAVPAAIWTIATGGLVTLAYLLAQGLATAAIVLVSEAVGAGEPEKAAGVGWTAIAATVVAMAACGAGCVAFAPAVAAAFAAAGPVQGALAAAMGLIALLMIPDGGQGAAEAVLRARGDNWFPTALRFVAFVVVAPLLALRLAQPGPGAASGVLLAIILVGTAALLAMLARLAWITRR